MPVDEKSFHQIVALSLAIKPGRFMRFYSGAKKPQEDLYKMAAQRVIALIEDFRITALETEDMPRYFLLLGSNRIAQVLLCLSFADFYFSTASGPNRKALAPDVADRRLAMADDIITYLVTHQVEQIDQNKVVQWAIDMHAPPSSERRLRRHLSSPPKSPTVQPARSDSSTPPAS